MTKNSGDWESLQGHDDHPAQFKHKAWVHEGGGSIYGTPPMYPRLSSLSLYIYIYGCHFGIFSSIYINSIEISCASGAWG